MPHPSPTSSRRLSCKLLLGASLGWACSPANKGAGPLFGESEPALHSDGEGDSGDVDSGTETDVGNGLRFVKDCPAGGIQLTTWTILSEDPYPDPDADLGALAFSAGDVSYQGPHRLRFEVSLVSSSLPWGSPEIDNDLSRVARLVEDLPSFIYSTYAGSFEFIATVSEVGGDQTDTWRCTAHWSHGPNFVVEHHLKPGYLPDRSIHILRNGAEPYDNPGDATWCNRQDMGELGTEYDDSWAVNRDHMDTRITVDGMSRLPEDVGFEVLFETHGIESYPSDADGHVSMTRLYVDGELAAQIDDDPSLFAMQTMFKVDYSPLLTWPAVEVTNAPGDLPTVRECP